MKFVLFSTIGLAWLATAAVIPSLENKFEARDDSVTGYRSVAYYVNWVNFPSLSYSIHRSNPLIYKIRPYMAETSSLRASLLTSLLMSFTPLLMSARTLERFICRTRTPILTNTTPRTPGMTLVPMFMAVSSSSTC